MRIEHLLIKEVALKHWALVKLWESSGEAKTCIWEQPVIYEPVGELCKAYSQHVAMQVST